MVKRYFSIIILLSVLGIRTLSAQIVINEVGINTLVCKFSHNNNI